MNIKVNCLGGKTDWYRWHINHTRKGIKPYRKKNKDNPIHDSVPKRGRGKAIELFKYVVEVTHGKIMRYYQIYIGKICCKL